VFSVFWTVVALVMTVVMGGIIAYEGDVIGRKYGKRRVTMFGLRPRHTAILITSVTGVMISAITTGVLFLLVPPVRDVILEGEQAIAMNNSLRAETRKLTRQRDDKQTAYVQAQTMLSSAQNDLRAMREKERQAREQFQQVNSQLGRAQSDLAAARRDRDAARKERLAALAQEREALRLNANLTRRNAALQEKNETLAAGNEALAKQSMTLAGQNAELEQTNESLKAANAQEQQKNEDYQQQNSEFAKQNEQLTRANSILMDINRRYNNDNKKLMEENQTLTATNKRLTQQLKDYADYPSLYDAYSAVRNRRVVVHGGEDLARRTVPANSPPDAVRKVVQELIHDAGMAASAKGAGLGEGARAVKVVDKQFFQVSPSGAVESVVEVTGEERVNAVVSRLAWQPVPYSVLALAVANSVEREPAAIDLQPLPDRLVFPKGRVVAARRFNTEQSPGQLFTEMVTFLKDMGQSTLDLGMIPRIDPATGEPLVGSLSAADIVGLVERARTIGGRVRISALAAADIHAADPLTLDFRIDTSL
jgi:uncharacterized protein (DUF3084 family)